MRVLWCGDAVMSTGFARCTHAVCDHLHEQGHEVHVLGINYFGDPHKYPYPIYVCRQPFDGGEDAWGVSRLPYLVARLKPDVIVLLNDPWNIELYLDELAKLPGPCPPVVAWLAVDARNQEGEPLNRLAHVVTWTQFATDELVRGGYTGPSDIVPLGVDTKLLYPVERSAAREKCMPGLDADTREKFFVVGVVGRNQVRKRLDLAIESFARWIHEGGDLAASAMLYLHVGPTKDSGVDIHSLCAYYKLEGRVFISNPVLGHGLDDSLMRYVYSCLDVCLTTTQGEGWGLTTLEAMACGVLNAAPNFAALSRQGGWVTNDSLISIPASVNVMTAPLNGNLHTIGAVPTAGAVVSALRRARLMDPAERAGIIERALDLAKSHTWHRAAVNFTDILQRVVSSAATNTAKASTVPNAD